ncbi:MAG: hypothetical protein ACREGD_03925 [Candidatus Saccharimonadales bacterium]
MQHNRRLRVRGRQRDDIDADLLAQLVILMGRQLAREAKGEAIDEDETLPARIPRVHQPKERQ